MVLVHSKDTTTQIIAPVKDLHVALIQHLCLKVVGEGGAIWGVPQVDFWEIDTIISNLESRISNQQGSKICIHLCYQYLLQNSDPQSPVRKLHTMRQTSHVNQKRISCLAGCIRRIYSGSLSLFSFPAHFYLQIHSQRA